MAWDSYWSCIVGFLVVLEVFGAAVVSCGMCGCVCGVCGCVSGDEASSTLLSDGVKLHLSANGSEPLSY